VVTVLAVLPEREDQASLRNIFSHSNWKVKFAQTFEEAEIYLRGQPVGVVITECTLAPGRSWKNLLDEIVTTAVPPPLIVTDRFADELLWSEVLNLGGYDVLMKPFDANEVYRVVSLAWLFWRHQWDLAAGRRKPPQPAGTLDESTVHVKFAAAP
jgi:DNA-binding response OmpR family regulator